MIRKGQWKFVYYVMMQPQLFNLDDDPDELHDLGTNPRYADICKQMETHLRSVCNPEAIDTMAKADQMAIINANGGVEAVVAKGGFGATPPPGTNAEYATER